MILLKYRVIKYHYIQIAHINLKINILTNAPLHLLIRRTPVNLKGLMNKEIIIISRLSYNPDFIFYWWLTWKNKCKISELDILGYELSWMSEIHFECNLNYCCWNSDNYLTIGNFLWFLHSCNMTLFKFHI